MDECRLEKAFHRYLLFTGYHHQPYPSPCTAPGTLQLQISSLDILPNVGRNCVGRISRGSIKAGDPVSLVKNDGTILKSVIKELYLFEGLSKEKVKYEVAAGEICAVLGPEEFRHWRHHCDAENPEGLNGSAWMNLPMSMVSPSIIPLCRKRRYLCYIPAYQGTPFPRNGKELALRVEETGSPDTFNVFGRGILHLAILVETMRREGL